MSRSWKDSEVLYVSEHYGKQETHEIARAINRSVPAVFQKAKRLGLKSKFRGARSTPPENRFWDKVRKADGCWIWVGGKDSHGYGTIWVGTSKVSKAVKAHRVSYKIHYGSIPDGLCVLHHCDNPECTNPNHLFLGTKRDNSVDMVEKRRHAFGSRIGNAKLCEADVELIRSLDKAKGKDIAKFFGVSPGLISMIRSGKRWEHVSRGN